MRRFIALSPVVFVLVFSKSEYKLTWLIVSIIAAVILKFLLLIPERLKRHKIFDEGNIPSVGNKSVLSGNVLELLKPRNNMEIVRSYHYKLGKTYGMFYGPDPWVFTIDKELVERVLINEGNKHVETMTYRTPFQTEVGKALIQLGGDEWRQVRRALNPSFSHKQMKTDNVFTGIEETCIKFLKCIKGHPIDESGARTLDMMYNFQKYTIEVIFKIAYGCENVINMEPNEKDKLVDSFESALKTLVTPFVTVCVISETMENILSHFTKFTEFGHYIKRIRSFLNQSLIKRREERKQMTSLNPEMRKMIDTLIEAVDSEQIDEDTLKSNMFFLLAAGFETTANTLTILFWYLCQRQEIQDKLRESIAVEGENSIYLQWCINETLRLYPAATGSVRVLGEDITLSTGQTIFKGTAVIPFIYAIHRYEEYWGKDAQEFRPERFGEFTPSPVVFLPFGRGVRGCLGKEMALAEMRAIITKLVLLYRVEPCETTPAQFRWCSPNLIHMQLKAPINMKFVELTTLNQ